MKKLILILAICFLASGCEDDPHRYECVCDDEGNHSSEQLPKGDGSEYVHIGIPEKDAGEFLMPKEITLYGNEYWAKFKDSNIIDEHLGYYKIKLTIESVGIACRTWRYINDWIHEDRVIFYKDIEEAPLKKERAKREKLIKRRKK